MSGLELSPSVVCPAWLFSGWLCWRPFPCALQALEQKVPGDGSFLQGWFPALPGSRKVLTFK